MKILKTINNNIVSAYDEEGREIVVMGKGIGFKAKDCKEIPRELVEKIFRMDSQDETDRLKALFSSLPMEHVRVSDNIITYAKNNLHKRLNQSIYITLTDHISFAVYRLQQGMKFHNALLMEVRRFYHEEYLIGKYSLDLIEKELGIRFPNDEAASIALHIVNAEYDTSISETMHITQLIQNILELVQGLLGIQLDEQSTSYERFVIHLKFLAQRVFKAETFGVHDPELVKMMSVQYPVEYQHSQKIADLIQQRCNHVISEEEKAYLTLHIRRIKTLEQDKV
ncbi:PRD domain-containing protein [Oscillospiraceae bacterium PP1C4]